MLLKILRAIQFQFNIKLMHIKNLAFGQPAKAALNMGLINANKRSMIFVF